MSIHYDLSQMQSWKESSINVIRNQYLYIIMVFEDRKEFSPAVAKIVSTFLIKERISLLETFIK